MTEHTSLDGLFRPRSVAIVGASPQRGNPRNSIVRVLLKHGYAGRVYPVSPSHTVAGNPDRLRTGDVTLRLDDEWVSGMHRMDRAVVTALTAPLRRLAS